jgi:TonB family protein
MPPQREARKCAPRVYPDTARFMGAYGTTVVLAEVASDGRVTNAIVTKSSGNSDAHKDLDRATLNHVRSCIFSKKPDHAFDHRPVSIH